MSVDTDDDDDITTEDHCEAYCEYMRDCAVISGDEAEYRCNVTCMADYGYRGPVDDAIECKMDAFCHELREGTDVCPGAPPPEGRDCIIIYPDGSVGVPSSCYDLPLGSGGASNVGGATSDNAGGATSDNAGGASGSEAVAGGAGNAQTEGAPAAGTAG